MSDPDGGPAFPLMAHISTDDIEPTHLGMSLRDFFAAEALSKMTIAMHEPDNPAREREGMAVAARMAYGFADAMLKARDKGKA